MPFGYGQLRSIRSSGRYSTLAYVIAIFLLLAFNAFVGGWVTERIVEYWASFVNGTYVDVPFWPCAVAWLLFAKWLLIPAVLTLLLSFVL